VAQVLPDMQLASIKGFNIAGFSEDTRIHVLTQRYATLTTSLLLLNADYQVSAVVWTAYMSICIQMWDPHWPCSVYLGQWSLRAPRESRGAWIPLVD
jgi:hypothetical protein